MVEQGKEEQWVRASRTGDSEAFASLVARYQKMIHALTFRMTGSLADSEDLAQETFLRAFQQIEAFRGQAQFSSWLYRIAVNACLNWKQQEGRRADAHDAWAQQEAINAPTAEPRPLADDVSQRVQTALLRLPAKQRAAIVLTVCDELSHAEAARALGCSETTVSWRVFAARGKLRRWLDSGGEP